MKNKRTKIKVAIDISPTIDGNAVRGVGYYTSQLVKSLQDEIAINPQYKYYKINLVTNPDDLRSTTYDLIHYPYFDPFKLTLPKQKIPFVVTVHDLIPIQFKNHFPAGIKGNIKWLIQKKHLKSAQKIITVSHYSKFIINKIVNFPLSKIFVTHLGADKSFKLITDQSKLKEIQKKYNLPNKFVLYVGDINWNKNIPSLVKACLKNKYPLVIVGSTAVKKDVPNHPWTKDLRWLQTKSRALEHRTTKKIILTGFVPDEDLPFIYNLSTIYCQPSFAEGFGLPLVQAMQSGCTVAYSQDTCLPEVMDNVGLSFNPRSVLDISSVLKKIWTDPKLRQIQQLLGINRSKCFNWKYTAKQTLAVYDLILSHEK